MYSVVPLEFTVLEDESASSFVYCKVSTALFEPNVAFVRPAAL